MNCSALTLEPLCKWEPYCIFCNTMKITFATWCLGVHVFVNKLCMWLACIEWDFIGSFSFEEIIIYWGCFLCYVFIACNIMYQYSFLYWCCLLCYYVWNLSTALTFTTCVPEREKLEKIKEDQCIRLPELPHLLELSIYATENCLWYEEK